MRNIGMLCGVLLAISSCGGDSGGSGSDAGAAVDAKPEPTPAERCTFLSSVICLARQNCGGGPIDQCVRDIAPVMMCSAVREIAATYDACVTELVMTIPCSELLVNGVVQQPRVCVGVLIR